MLGKPQRVIEAERIIIRGSTDQKKLAEIGEGEAGSVSMRMFDSAELCRVELVVARDGAAGLQFWDACGRPRIIIALDADGPDVGTPSVSMMRKDGKCGLSIALSPDGAAILSLLR